MPCAMSIDPVLKNGWIFYKFPARWPAWCQRLMIYILTYILQNIVNGRHFKDCMVDIVAVSCGGTFLQLTRYFLFLLSRILRHLTVSQENQDDPFPKNTRKPYNYNSVLFDFYGEFS